MCQIPRIYKTFLSRPFKFQIDPNISLVGKQITVRGELSVSHLIGPSTIDPVFLQTIHVYIYIYRERERKKNARAHTHAHTHTYIYIERER